MSVTAECELRDCRTGEVVVVVQLLQAGQLVVDVKDELHPLAGIMQMHDELPDGLAGMLMI